MVRQTDQAMAQVAEDLGVSVANHMGGPVLDPLGKPIGHQFVVELRPESMRPPEESWAKRLDAALQERNGDYKAKRTSDLILARPQVHFVPPGTFERWLKSRARLGGQHKVPRLTQQLGVVEALMEQGVQELSPTC